MSAGDVQWVIGLLFMISAGVIGALWLEVKSLRARLHALSNDMQAVISTLEASGHRIPECRGHD